MSLSTTRIIIEVSLPEFQELIERHKHRILVSPHALDRVSDAQRKVYKPESLKTMLGEETPCGVGLQKNGRYAVFFRRDWGFVRLICEIKSTRLEITTFYNTATMPHLKALDNE